MKTYHFKKIILFSILLGSSQVSWAACTQTLSPGANLATAISSAAAGSTICLNSGNYGSATLSGISKSSAVTLQSASGVGATIDITLGSSNNLIFKNLTLSSLQWSNNSNSNIKVLNNVFTGQMYIYGNGGSQNNLIDGNTFDGISVGASAREGRLSIYGGGNLIVSNNHFGNRGESDGIQIGGTGSIIGPGNVFDGLTQEGYTRHVDSIQQYGEVDSQTITGNYFINDTVCIGDYESSANSTVTNNVFIATDSNNMRCVLDFGSSTNLNFSHNTVKSLQMRVGAINLSTGSTGVIKRNIFLNNSFTTPGAGFSGTIDSNIFTSSSIVKGTNALIGTPTFIGGSNPTTMAGYQLTTSSLGYSTSADNIMGVNTFGIVTVVTSIITAPSNLRIQ